MFDTVLQYNCLKIVITIHALAVYKYNFFFFFSSDSEIIGYALDTLYNIISNDDEEEVGKFLLLCFLYKIN